MKEGNFWSYFFGSGGTGSSLVSSAGTIGLGIVQNDKAKIQGDYQVKLQGLMNDASLSDAQFQLQLTRLTQEREAALAKFNDEKRTDTLMLVGVIGGLLLVATVLVVLILKKPTK
ncbi:hypothetical protein [Spirosoma areae]